MQPRVRLLAGAPLPGPASHSRADRALRHSAGLHLLPRPECAQTSRSWRWWRWTTAMSGLTMASTSRASSWVSCTQPGCLCCLPMSASGLRRLVLQGMHGADKRLAASGDGACMVMRSTRMGHMASAGFLPRRTAQQQHCQTRTHPADLDCRPAGNPLTDPVSEDKARLPCTAACAPAILHSTMHPADPSRSMQSALPDAHRALQGICSGAMLSIQGSAALRPHSHAGRH